MNKMNDTKTRPNILLILSEQQRGDCLSCEDHPVLLTPTMDEIGLHGARLSRFYSDCPVCIPARRTLLAGQFPASHGMFRNDPKAQWNPSHTLAQTLRDHGYQTRWIGRNMHQQPATARFGYDEIEDGSCSPGTEYSQWLSDNAPKDSGGWMAGGIMHNDRTAHPWPLPEHLHNTNWTVERALRFLARRDTTCPFFLTISFMAAHPPLQPPAFYMERYLRTGVPEPVIGDWAQKPHKTQAVSSPKVDLTGEAMLSARAAYYGLINHLDDQLRRILNAITGIKQGTDTIVCFTSDHGEMLGDHYAWAKQLPYEGAARVPFLISGPPELGIQQRAVIDHPATLADVMPTLLDMVNVPIPDSVDGQSLLPLLQGKTMERPFVHMEIARRFQALTDGKEKYVWFPANGKEQLFDLTADPNELNDLSASPAHEKSRLMWRQRLIERLAGRAEGYSDGQKLQPAN